MWMSAVACGHVSGLCWCGRVTAGPGGIRDGDLDQVRGIGVPLIRQISPSLGRLTTSVGTFSSQASRCALVGPRPQTVATASRKPVWRTITAQMIRAILLASATAATKRGLVSSSRLSHGSVLARLLPSTA